MQSLLFMALEEISLMSASLSNSLKDAGIYFTATTFPSELILLT
jgi:hypothetical protein